MIGQHLIELFQPFRVDLLYGDPYLLVNLLSPLVEQTVIRHLLRKGMFEDVFQLREKALLIDELQSLKVDKIGF